MGNFNTTRADRLARRASRGSMPGRADRDSSGMNSPEFKREQRRNYRQILAGMGVKAKQKWFRNMGYHVAVDGIEGPQTRAAQKAFLGGVQARVWNKRGQGGGRAGGGGGGAAAASHPADLNPGTAPIGGGGGRGGGRRRRYGGGGGGGEDFDLINPGKYARGSVESEYGPLLGQIGRDITQGRAQGRQNLADIGSWFQQLEATRAQGQAGNESALQQSLGGFDTAQQGIMNALGGGEQAAVAAGYGAAARAGLAGMGQAQGDFDRRMGAILASQGNDARMTEQGRQSQIMSDLLGKRQDLFKAKGSALAKALAEAQILRTQQRGQNIEQQNMLQQMGINADQADQQFALNRQQLGMNRQQMNRDARNQRFSEQERQLDYDIKRAQYEDFLDNLRTTKGGNIDFGTLDEQSRMGLANSIRSMATGPRGNWTGGYNQTWNRIKNGLQMAGYNIKDPAIRRFGMAIMGSIRGYPGKRGNKKK